MNTSQLTESLEARISAYEKGSCSVRISGKVDDLMQLLSRVGECHATVIEHGHEADTSTLLVRFSAQTFRRVEWKSVA